MCRGRSRINMQLKRERFEVEAVGPPGPGYLLTLETGARTREQIYDKITRLKPNTVLELDFSSIEYMGAVASSEILVKILKRLESGEYPDRFFILSHVQARVVREMEYGLKVGGRAAIIVNDGGWEIVGDIFHGFRRALNRVIEMGSTTAQELRQTMGYKTVNEASTQLSYLSKRCLIAREPLNRRKFRYLSLLEGHNG